MYVTWNLKINSIYSPDGRIEPEVTAFEGLITALTYVNFRRYMCVRRAALHLLALLLLVCTTRAGLVNISIDDTYGDLTTGLKPIYQPTGSPWYGPGCSGSSCGSISPSASSAFDATWTAASYTSSLGNMSITLSFTGSKFSLGSEFIT